MGRYGLRFLTALGVIFLAFGSASCGLDSKVNELVNPPAQKTVPEAAITVDSETVSIGRTVYLSGSDSADPQGKTLTYAWTLQVPTGSAAVLSSATTVTTSFTPDKSGEYLVSLTVTNSSSVSSGTVTVKLTTSGSGTNNPPVAVTTAALTGTTDSTVVLDASGSYDDDDQTLTYTWTLLGSPSTSAVAAVSDSSSVTAFFIPDVVGTYTVKLVVSDGMETDEATVVVTVTTQTASTIPVASFTISDDTVIRGTPVLLDASASYDPQELALTYTWNIEAPVGSAAALSSTSSVVTQFTPDVGGVYVVYLKVTNSSSISSSTVTGSVSAVGTGTNLPPVAITSSTVSGTVGTITFLDGSQSYDPDQQGLAYLWTLISAPAGSAVGMLNDLNLNLAYFTPDVAGTYIVTFLISDGWDTDQVTVTVQISAAGTGTNRPPVAVTNTAVSGTQGEVLLLDGSQSYDFDQQSLTYSWTFVSVPAGSAVATLTANTSKEPYFTPDLAGTYIIKFTVSDGTDSDIVYVTVTVAGPLGPL